MAMATIFFSIGRKFFSSIIFLKAQWLTQTPTAIFLKIWGGKSIENFQAASKIQPLCSWFTTMCGLIQWRKCELFFDLSVWTVFKHSLFSPNLAPCHYCLFLALKTSFGERRFENNKELKLETGHFFRNLPTTFIITTYGDYHMVTIRIWT